MKKLLFTITILFTLTFMAFAQDKVRVSAVYSDSRIPLIGNGADYNDGEPVKGFSVQADATLFKLGYLRGSVAYVFEQRNNVEVFPDYFDGMNIVDLYRDVRTHYVGAQLGYTLGGAVEPFAAYLVAPRQRVHEDAEPQVAQKIRVGINAPFVRKSPFFITASVDFNKAYGSPNRMFGGGFVNSDFRQINLGAGFRF